MNSNDQITNKSKIILFFTHAEIFTYIIKHFYLQFVHTFRYLLENYTYLQHKLFPLKKTHMHLFLKEND